MKKCVFLLTITATFLLGGCSISSYEAVYYTDYTRYMKQSFFVSALSDFTGYPYVALGDITVEYGVPATMVYSATIDKADGTTSQTMLNMLVKQAKAKGANGVINVKISYHPNTNRSGQSYWIANGIAVYFDTLPAMPQTIASLPVQFESGIEEPVFNAQKWINDTIAFLLENRQPLYKYIETGQLAFFDVETKQYINSFAFVKKYGKEPKDALVSQYEKEYKERRKAERAEKQEKKKSKN